MSQEIPPSPCDDKPTWTLRQLLEVLPDLPGHLLRVSPTVVNRPISGAMRERIMLAVAAENRCWYCQTAHRTFGQAQGISGHEVDLILAGDHEGLGEAQAQALRFVRDLARRGFRSRDEELYEALLRHYTEGQRAAIESTAHLMNLANRFGNTFDAALARLARRCERSGAPPLDLALISSVFMGGFVAVAPLVGVLALKQRLRGPARVQK